MFPELSLFYLGTPSCNEGASNQYVLLVIFLNIHEKGWRPHVHVELKRSRRILDDPCVETDGWAEGCPCYQHDCVHLFFVLELCFRRSQSTPPKVLIRHEVFR